jgi:agmatinase
LVNNLSPGTGPIFLGGDHSITLSTLRALRKIHSLGKRKLACIHFDAHCDTWKDHFGEPSGHGTWVREAVEQGLIQPECTIQIGIRSSGDEEARTFVQTRGGVILTGREMRGVDSVSQISDAVISRVTKRLKEYGSPPCYLTFDIDCLDPAFAPGTGTPEPGGLTSNQALTIIEELSASSDINFVGMDCVEVAPAYDHAELTSMMAAHLVWTYLCGWLRLLQDRQK